jgi:hypothetical protein
MWGVLALDAVVDSPRADVSPAASQPAPTRLAQSFRFLASTRSQLNSDATHRPNFNTSSPRHQRDPPHPHLHPHQRLALAHPHPPVRQPRASTDLDTPAARASVLILDMAITDAKEMPDPAALVEPMLSELCFSNPEWGQQKWEVMNVRSLLLHFETGGSRECVLRCS